MCKTIQVSYPACGHTIVYRTIKCDDTAKSAFTYTNGPNADPSIAGLAGLGYRQVCRTTKPVQLETETYPLSTKKCPSCEMEDARLEKNKGSNISYYKRKAKNAKKDSIMGGRSERERAPSPEPQN